MLKKEFVDEMQTRLNGKSKKEIAEFVDAFVDTVTYVLAGGGNVKLANFGTFKMREIAEHNGINPTTKEKITVPKKASPCFKIAPGLKNAVAK